MNNWKNIQSCKPPVGVRVLLKRDFSVGIGGGTGMLEWTSEGLMTVSNNWSVKVCEGLTYDNSKPTHWKLKSVEKP